MSLPEKIDLETQTFYVDKTGIPFFDAARLIGTAHFFFGTASAEIKDEGARYEVKGVKGVSRDKDQIEWMLELGKKKSWDLQQKSKQLKKAMQETYSFANICSSGTPTSDGYAALKEFDAAVQYGPRGPDSLKDRALISSQGTKPKRKDKQFLLSSGDLIFSSLGFSFSAFSKSSGMRTYILPVFGERVVISGFLEFRRSFTHSAGNLPAVVLSAVTILLDLIAQRIPVVDFVYTSIYGQNIFSSSGYLGLEHLCSLWWEAVEKDMETRLEVIREVQSFLAQTSSRNTSKQVQDLARWVAKFAANPDVQSLTMIQRLKGRIDAAQSAQYAVHRLFNSSEVIKEVAIMIVENLPAAPWQVTEALAHTFSLDEKGWMNPFTRLENATSFSIFVTQVERIISRGFYREQQESGKNIREAIQKSKNLGDQLRGLAYQLSDDKTFRAFKAVFLLEVLSKMRRPSKEESEPEEISAEKGGE